MKKKIIFFIIAVFLILFVSFWTIVSGGYDKQNKTILFLKKIIPVTFARKVRDTIFFIPQLQDRNKFLENQITKYEQGLKGKLFFEKNSEDRGKSNYNLKKFFLPFPSLDLTLGWNATKNSTRAHYLELVDDKVLVISGEGETIFFNKKNINKKSLSQNYLNNNLKKLFFSKGTKLAAIRDLYYEDNFIYITVVEILGKKSTLNVYRAAKDFTKLNFELFFESKEYSDKYTLQSGGRLEKFKDNEILLSIGFFDQYEKAQNVNSTAGKIISINKFNKKYKIKSMGHRNPQGLLYLKEKNIIINSEHGPKGGDEINFNYLNQPGVKDFGWPISSYGKGYTKEAQTFFDNKGYLKKSHSDFGFIEPKIYFVPSIGISEIIYNDSKLYASSLRAESIYVIEDKNEKKLNVVDRIKFDNRIRDLKFDKKEDIFYIIFENTPAVGILKFF
jgi:hypothetical protein